MHQPQNPTCKGRPRSTESRRAIMDAALQSLQETPLRDLTVEAIAQRAGVGKATIYKWWPTKAYVTLEAFLDRMGQDVETFDTGSAKLDLLCQLKAVIRFYNGKTGRLICQFIAESQADPEFAALYRERFVNPRRQAVWPIWQRGVDRGEIDPDVDREVVIDLIYAPVIYRVLSGHAPLNGTEAERFVEAVFAGLGGGCKQSNRRENNRGKPDRKDKRCRTS